MTTTTTHFTLNFDAETGHTTLLQTRTRNFADPGDIIAYKNQTSSDADAAVAFAEANGLRLIEPLTSGADGTLWADLELTDEEAQR